MILVSSNTYRRSDKIICDIRCFEWTDVSDHLDQIVIMQLENTYRYHYPHKKPNEGYVRRKVLELEEHLKRGNTYFIGATKGRRLLGYIWCYEAVFIDERRMSINSLFVCEDARRSGLGQLLMDEAKRIAICSGCDSIGTHYASFNEAAGAFYAKNGFVPARIEVVCTLP